MSNLTFSKGKDQTINNSWQFWVIPSFCFSIIKSDTFPGYMEKEKWKSYAIVVRFGFWSVAMAYKVYT